MFISKPIPKPVITRYAAHSTVDVLMTIVVRIPVPTAPTTAPLYKLWCLFVD